MSQSWDLDRIRSHLKFPDTTNARYPMADIPPDSRHPFLEPSGRKTTGCLSLSGPDLLPKMLEYIPEMSSSILPSLPSGASMVVWPVVERVVRLMLDCIW